MEFAASALQHLIDEVEERASRIISGMFQKHHKTILDYLPPVQVKIRKSVLCKALFEGFVEKAAHDQPGPEVKN
ncbi:UNVERIFIED_CONTAM: hypothetical protein K2H54_016256 [Gekko kuhli]